LFSFASMRVTVKPAIVLLGVLCLLAGGGCVPTPGERADEQREPHFLQGKSRHQAYDYPGAIESFERALEVNPRSGAAHFELGFLYGDKVKDQAIAIYHYQRFLRLRPESPLADNIRQRIHVCKQILASEVSLGPVSQQIQQDIEKLAAENTRLKQRTAELEEILTRATNATLAAVAPRPAAATSAPGTPPRNEPAPLALNSTVTPRSEPKAAPAPARSYTVKAGDNPTSIAQRFGISVAALKAANPGLSERNLQIGKSLTIPAR
jgi:LysM repeat protein